MIDKTPATVLREHERAEPPIGTAAPPAKAEVDRRRRNALISLLRVSGYVGPATIVTLSMMADAGAVS